MNNIVLLVDLEGTLCNNAGRVELFMSQEWEEYEDACGRDIAYPEIVEFLQNVSDVAQVIIITNRSEKYYGTTVDWFVSNDIGFDGIYMRPELDIPKTKEAELKLALFSKAVEENEWPKGTVFIALEDRDEVIEAYRNAGIFCWQVRNGVIG